jgi:YHS domain-containing protein
MKTTIITLTTAILALASCKPGESGADASATEAASAETTGATPYPLDTCLVSGERLGAMGTPPEIVYQGQQIKFCCKNCIPDFEKEPEKFLSKMKETGAAQ